MKYMIYKIYLKLINMNIIINELIYVRLFLYINITLIIKSYIHFHLKLLFVLNKCLELVEFHLYIYK